MKKCQLQRGFTLLELMIALAIIGLLAGVAYPSYLKSAQKANRTEAKTELMDAAQRLQRCYTAYASFTYTSEDKRCGVYTQLTAKDGMISRGEGYYKIDFASAPTATAYTLRATAIKNPQTKDTECLTMTLSSVGVKTPDPSNCW